MDAVEEHRGLIVELAATHDLTVATTATMPYALIVVGRGHEALPQGQTILMAQAVNALQAAGQLAAILEDEAWLEENTPLWRGPIRFALTLRATSSSAVLYSASTSTSGCTIGAVFLTADPVEPPRVVLTNTARPTVSLFDSMFAHTVMQSLRDLPGVVGGQW